MPVFAYFDVWCIADSRDAAVRQISSSLECSKLEVSRHVTQIKGPFGLACCGETEYVSEEEFCLKVSRDRNGIVYDGS